ncbi:MAG: MBOAT family O-acyltransferase [Bdellovibrionales bacterium]
MILGLNGFSTASCVLVFGALLLWLFMRFNVRLKFAYAVWVTLMVAVFFYLKVSLTTIHGQDPSPLDSLFQTQLPLGFSFVMFFALSFALSALLGRPSVAAGDRLKALAANSFFPSLLAGPFLRIDQLARFENLQPVAADLTAGFLLIFWGLAKKLLADRLGASYLEQPNYFQLANSADAWTNLVLIPVRFYCDFSGIADIAIGMARTFGIEIPPNFNLPFLSSSPSEYWQRWHISLGEWFRHYFYNPFIFKLWPVMGRILNPMLFNSLAIIATMLLVGIWHGLHPRFFIWALYNGVWIVAFPFMMAPLRRLPKLHRWAGCILTFYLIAIGMLLLTYADTGAVLKRLTDLHVSVIHGGLNAFTFTPALLLCLAALIVTHFCDALWIKYHAEICARRRYHYPILIVLISIYLLFYKVSMPFIYSRF